MKPSNCQVKIQAMNMKTHSEISYKFNVLEYLEYNREISQTNTMKC